MLNWFVGNSAIWRSSVIFPIRFCHLTVSTLAHDRQKRKGFLTVKRRDLTVDRQNLSFPIQQNQTVDPFPFLTIKNPSSIPTPARAPTAQAKAAGIGPYFLRPRPTPHKGKESVDNSDKFLALRWKSDTERPEARREIGSAFRKEMGRATEPTCPAFKSRGI